MKKLPVIPRPAAARWRDLRMRVVPVVTYAIAVGLVGYLWNTQWMPHAFTGEVQSRIASVSSPLDGMLVDSAVQQFDHVAKDQALGKVVLSPGTVYAGLEAIRADLLVLRARMTVDGQRNQLNYQQVRVDQLDQKVSLAIARSKLRFAENELRRQQELHSQKIASDFDYETALDQRDALVTEVLEREGLVAETGKALAQLNPAPSVDGHPQTLDAIDSAIQAQENRFRDSVQTILRAPMDGMVTKVFRNVGENISAGEPLVTISGELPESIVGFVRQPISFEPKVGDVVVVRTRRGTKRQRTESRILKVGARLEFFTQSLRVRGFDSSQERGLPVLIEAPAELALYPGELVDLSLKN
jgi:multidrug resistance efflux pump